MRRAWGHQFSILLGMLLSLPGCLVVQVGVTNPIPDLSTVAVVPFFNQSSEPAQVVDGRRFATMYATELQKVHGFQVLPVGVTETAIVRHQIDLNRPGDVLRLAEVLDVDAVVVGSVTHYEPYYPPRVGLHVDWYSRDRWEFRPGIPVAPVEKPGLLSRVRCWLGHGMHEEVVCEEPMEIRGQSPVGPPRLLSPPPLSGENAIAGTIPALPPGPITADGPMAHRTYDPPPAFGPTHTTPLDDNGQPLPLMSYTRMFDGADANLQAILRDYVEFLGDERSGGWRAYLYRSDDFLRFTSHLMIVEMLTLHGGEAQRKYVWKPRKTL